MAALSGISPNGISFGVDLSQISVHGESAITGAHNRWRCRVTAVSASDDQVAFSEIELFTMDSLSQSVAVNWAGTDYTNTYSASSEYSTSYSADEAFDGATNVDGWVSEAADEIDAWVEVNLENAQEILGIHVWFSGSGVGNDGTPLQFVLEFYNESLGIWVTKMICDVPVEAQSADWDGAFWYEDIKAGDADLPVYTAEGEVQELLSTLITLPLYEATGIAHEEAQPELPAYEVDATGLNGSVANLYEDTFELPSYDGEGALISGQVGSGAGELPSIEAQGEFEREAGGTLPLYVGEGTGLTGQLISGSASIPSIVVAGEGFTEGASTLSEVLPVYEMAGQAESEGIGNADITLTKIILSADGYAGTVSTVAVAIPAYEIDAEGYPEYVGDVAVTMPMLTLEATTATDVTEAGAYALNLAMRGLTQFTAYGYNSFATFNGVTLAAGDNGLFAIAGETDDGTNIDASFGMHNKEPMSGRMRSAVANYRTDGQLILRVIPEETDDVYEYTMTKADDVLSKARTKLGRGIKGSNWQFEVSNVDGSDFEFDSIDITADETQRRVK